MSNRPKFKEPKLHDYHDELIFRNSVKKKRQYYHNAMHAVLLIEIFMLTYLSEYNSNIGFKWTHTDTFSFTSQIINNIRNLAGCRDITYGNPSAERSRHCSSCWLQPVVICRHVITVAFHGMLSVELATMGHDPLSDPLKHLYLTIGKKSCVCIWDDHILWSLWSFKRSKTFVSVTRIYITFFFF